MPSRFHFAPPLRGHSASSRGWDWDRGRPAHTGRVPGPPVPGPQQWLGCWQTRGFQGQADSGPNVKERGPWDYLDGPIPCQRSRAAPGLVARELPAGRGRHPQCRPGQSGKSKANSSSPATSSAPMPLSFQPRRQILMVVCLKSVFFRTTSNRISKGTTALYAKLGRTGKAAVIDKPDERIWSDSPLTSGARISRSPIFGMLFA